MVYDAGEEERKLVSLSDKKSGLKILGMNTRVIRIEYEDGSTSKYWYSSEIFINPVQFKNLKFAFLNKYWEKVKSPYLKHERNSGKWEVIHVAKSIEPRKLKDNVFKVL